MRPIERKDERIRSKDVSDGSALLLTVFVSVIVAVLGLSLLLSAQTESRIARNERLATQALFAAESGARAVKSWFDRPGRAPGFPSLGVVIRERLVLDEDDPYGATPSIPGTQYKEGVDLDGNGEEDLFRWPYRGTDAQTLLGTLAGPDMRIEDPTYLATLSETLFGEFPDAQAGLRARVRRIEVRAPPYVRIDGTWRRHGIGTVEVVAGIEEAVHGGGSRLLAQRTATWVLNEIPYTRSVRGPVHSCGDLEIIGEIAARWGVVSARRRILAPGGLAVPLSLPRTIPGHTEAPLWTDDAVWVSEFGAKIDTAVPIPDPWLQLVAGEDIDDAPTSAAQPFAGPEPPPVGQPGPWSCCDVRAER